MAIDRRGRLGIDEAVEETVKRQQPAAARKAPARVPPPGRPAGTHYGGLYAPPARDLEELRRQQAAFAGATAEIDRQNSWMAIPALAPGLVVGGLAGAGALAARLAPAVVARGPLVLTERMPYLRVGDNWATRKGRRAHAAFKAKVRQKQEQGWEPEPTINIDGRIVRPDAVGPVRNWKPNRDNLRFQLELKPDTPSGRQVGARATARYKRLTGNPARAVYYNPKDFR